MTDVFVFHISKNRDRLIASGSFLFARENFWRNSYLSQVYHHLRHVFIDTCTRKDIHWYYNVKLNIKNIPDWTKLDCGSNRHHSLDPESARVLKNGRIISIFGQYFILSNYHLKVIFKYIAGN